MPMTKNIYKGTKLGGYSQGTNKVYIHKQTDLNHFKKKISHIWCKTTYELIENICMLLNNMIVLGGHNVAIREVSYMIAELFKAFCKVVSRPHVVISFKFIQNQETWRKETVLQDSTPKKLTIKRQKRSHATASLEIKLTRTYRRWLKDKPNLVT